MSDLIVRQWTNLMEYPSTWETMKTWTNQRTAETPDEIWLLEHLPVFTQGLAGKSEHVLNAGPIPVVRTDRGGQITYHGPGQLVIYLLLDIQRLGLNSSSFVRRIETWVIDYLKTLGITAAGKPDAPGVYVNNAKICSIGLRIRKGCSYHGLALNVAMDLTPFSRINPCGFSGLEMTQIADYAPMTLSQVRDAIIPHFVQHFGYNHVHVF